MKQNPKRKPWSRAKQIRHTHKTAAGIEDAIAVLLDIMLDLTALAARFEKVMEILRIVRSGPHAYDPERPAGARNRRRQG